MANLTIEIEDEVLRRAYLRAVAQGTSVGALLWNTSKASLERVPRKRRRSVRFWSSLPAPKVAARDGGSRATIFMSAKAI